MTKKKQLIIHIGAHKTATTHLQDTLSQMQNSLNELDIKYLPRGEYRKKIQLAIGRKFVYIDRLAFGMIATYYFKNLFANGSETHRKILISEENILGNIVDQISIKPYQHNLENRLYFIKRLSKKYDVKLLLSIRSFVDIYPGAYATSLRLFPQEAINAKKQLVDDLKQGEVPRWVDLIRLVKKILPNLKLLVWTQEDYRNHSNQVISKIIDSEDEDIVQIPPPSVTVTPSLRAISKAEQEVERKGEIPVDWPTICDDIYRQNQPSDTCEKYSFIDQDTRKKLQDSYARDLEEIKHLWPNEMISCH